MSGGGLRTERPNGHPSNSINKSSKESDTQILIIAASNKTNDIMKCCFSVPCL